MLKTTRIENVSANQPIKGGMSAPPTITITISKDPNLVCCPNPRMPSAKIVGYMIDMKKQLKKSAETESQPR